MLHPMITTSDDVQDVRWCYILWFLMSDDVTYVRYCSRCRMITLDLESSSSSSSLLAFLWMSGLHPTNRLPASPRHTLLLRHPRWCGGSELDGPLSPRSDPRPSDFQLPFRIGIGGLIWDQWTSNARHKFCAGQKKEIETNTWNRDHLYI